jgi:Zn-dependent protease with chaperone function
MEETLTVSQLQAVLAHEYAHLRQWHGWAVRIAQINALCLPRVLPGRALQRATVLLIELAADDAAARQAGAAHLANALTVLANTTGDESMHLRAVRLTARRWPSAGRRRLPQAIRILPT